MVVNLADLHKIVGDVCSARRRLSETNEGQFVYAPV